MSDSRIRQRIDDFYKRWNIESNDHRQELLRFQVRLRNALSGIDSFLVTSGKEQFCQVVGRPFSNYAVSGAFAESLSDRQLFFLLEALFLIPNSMFTGSTRRSVSLQKVKEAVDYSNLDVRVVSKGDDVYFVPAGEDLLDKAIVNRTLTFLDEVSQPHFVEALKLSMEKNAKASIKSAESLRRCLEEFLRFKLSNQAGLSSNIGLLQRTLKNDGRDPQIRNVISSCLGYLDQYFNENSKHADGDIDETENEYLIYQVGTLLRYIDKAIDK